MVGYDPVRKVTIHDVNEFAARRMEDILEKLRPVSCEEAIGPNFHSRVPAGFEVPDNHPALMAKGGNSLIFRLDNVFKEWHWERNAAVGHVNLVAKASFYSKLKQDSYLLSAMSSGLSRGSLQTTVETLRTLGLPVQDLTEKSVEMHGIGRFFTIAPDLTERGRYLVADAEEIDFGSLTNGSILAEKYDRMWRSVMDCIGSKRIKVEVAAHGTETDPSEAVKRMFLVQYERAGEGKLVICDLNHLTLSTQ